MGSGCVAQLAERLLPTPEVRSLNPVIGKNYIEHRNIPEDLNPTTLFYWDSYTASHSTTTYPMNRAMGWYTAVTLLYVYF